MRKTIMTYLKYAELCPNLRRLYFFTDKPLTYILAPESKYGFSTALDCYSGGARTHDLCIKSAKLYQLSYEVKFNKGENDKCEN